MKKKNFLLQFVVISVVGTVCHFVYEWSGGNMLVGLFAPVNESTWEHLKLLFFPAVVYSAVEYFFKKPAFACFIPATALGILSGMLVITVLFYTYSGILGFDVSVVNIMLFFVGVLVMLAVKSAILAHCGTVSPFFSFFSLLYLFVTAVLFAIWSYAPTSLGIFVSPVFILENLFV